MKFNVIVMAALAVAIVGSPGASASGSQTWYLDAEDSLVADRNAFSGTPDYVDVFASEDEFWWANEAAAIDVDFADGVFTWNLVFEYPYTGEFAVQIISGSGDETQPYDVAGTGFSGPVASAMGVSGSVPGTAFVVAAGETLGLRVLNAPGSDILSVKVSDGESYFQSPSNDPGYPTPELATLVLMGAGLGLVAVAVNRRRA